MSAPTDPGPPVRSTWRDSDRYLPRRFVQPVLRLMEVEAAAGVVMLVAAVAALGWASSPWHRAYEQLWETPVIVRVGNVVDLHDLTLRGWVNNAAMALFFLLAGLEIKRQVVHGELRDRRAAALPALAALGGIVVPAVMYAVVNHGHAGSGGWGIPVATDIAFAVGVVTLAGSRVPVGGKIFVLTLAVVDDIGGIVVIAVFYAHDVRLAWLLVAAVAVAATLAIRRADVRSLIPYVCLGTTCWLGLHQAGVEPAIVGVIFGLLTPITPFHDPSQFGETARSLVEQIDGSSHDGRVTDDAREHNQIAVEDLARFATESSSPLQRIEHRLGLWVSLAIVPLFAFANAGVRVRASALDHRVIIGVGIGLVIGKAAGVFGFSYLAVRLGIGRLPAGVTWRQLFGLAITTGIGFTVALFIASLSFDDPELTASAKLAVLGASAVAGVLGLAWLRAGPRSAND